MTVRRTAALLALLLGLVFGSGRGTAARADGPDWESTGLGDPVIELVAPEGGVLFARTGDALLRSEDGGASWAPVPLPPAPRAIAVDPTDPAVLYAAGSGGLYRSGDGGASWAFVLPLAERVLRIAPSPADHRLVYLAVSGPEAISADFRLLRSRDGGASWDVLQESHNSLCGWSVLVLEPHPTDAQRVFRTAGCYAGRDTGDALEESADQGATWTDLLRPELAFPTRLVGGRGEVPGRFYLAANRDARAGGSSLFRADDATTWAEILAFRGGGTLDRPDAPDVRVGGLAYDPSQPQRVYVGLNRYVGQGSARALAGGGVLASTDGGATWAELGSGDPGELRALALGPDGQDLYAATDRGLWRLRLTGPAGQERAVRLQVSPSVARPGETIRVEVRSAAEPTPAGTVLCLGLVGPGRNVELGLAPAFRIRLGSVMVGPGGGGEAAVALRTDLAAGDYRVTVGGCPPQPDLSADLSILARAPAQLPR